MALFGSTNVPGVAVKVAFGAAAAPPARIGALTLNSGEGGLYAMVLDSAHNVALLSADGFPITVVKVALGAPGDAPTRVNSLTLNAGDDGSNGGAVDVVNGIAIFTTYDFPSHAISVAMGNATDVPVRLGGTTLDAGQDIVTAIVTDPNTALAYSAGGQSPVTLATLAYTGKSTLAATQVVLAENADVTDVHFYSHTAAGNLQLGIYDNSADKKLLWQSNSVPNTGNGAEVVVNISAGTPPSLMLLAGTYYLAWQSDSVAKVASFTAGTSGDGFSAYQRFGNYPATIPAASQTVTADRYTEYITYTTDAALDPPTFIVDSLANPSDAGLGQSIEFFSLAQTDKNGATISYSWDFGDSSAGTGSTTTHSYAAAGDYLAAVTADDGMGATATRFIDITVAAPTITVAANPTQATSGVPVAFDAAAFFYVGDNVSYAWDFGDGNTGTGASPSHTYNTGGTITATVTATDSVGGATVSGSVQLQITPVPVVLTSGPTPSSSPAGVGQNVTFSAAATGTPGITLSYAWNFGDGNMGTGASIMHIYTAPGNYTVTVTVTDGLGGHASGTLMLTVQGPIIGSGTTDSDGDGFSDSFETANGTSPTDGASTPFDNVSASVPGTLTVLKPQISLNFAKPGSDSIKFGGTLDVPANYAGGHVYVVVGDLLQKFTVSSASKFSAKVGGDSIKLTIKATKGVIAHQTGKYSVSLSKGTFATALAPSGLTGTADIKTPQPRSVPYALFFNGQAFQKTVTMQYTAKKGASGKAK